MLGYLNGISFLGYDFESYPNSQKTFLNILPYPTISYHIPTYPKISLGANSQMFMAWTHRHTYQYISLYTCQYMYIPVRTRMYQYILVHTTTSTYLYIQYILVCTSTYQYILVHTSIYWYVPVCTGIYWYIQLIFAVLLRCWGAGVCAGHNCRDPAISLQHHRWYRRCSL